MNRNVHHSDMGAQVFIETDEPVESALASFCFDNEAKQEEWATALVHF